jgi:hypothetical protein
MMTIKVFIGETPGAGLGRGAVISFMLLVIATA